MSGPENANARSRVVHAAIEAIETHGPAVGMSRISELTGIARPNLYRLFPSKESLDADVIACAGADLVSHVRPHLASSGTAFELVRGVVTPVVAWASDHANLYRFLVAQKQVRALNQVTASRSKYLDDILATIHRGLRSRDMPPQLPEHVLATLMGMVDAAVLWWLDHDDDESSDEIVDRLARHITMILIDSGRRSGIPLDEETTFNARRFGDPMFQE